MGGLVGGAEESSLIFACAEVVEGGREKRGFIISGRGGKKHKQDLGDYLI